MHLVGLCDEYKELFLGYYVDSKTGYLEVDDLTEQTDISSKEDRNFSFKPAFDCRVVQTNSIMSDPYERWYRVFGNIGRAQSGLMMSENNSIGGGVGGGFFNKEVDFSTRRWILF